MSVDRSKKTERDRQKENENILVSGKVRLDRETEPERDRQRNVTSELRLQSLPFL